MGKTKGRSGDRFRECAALLHNMQNRNRLRVFQELRENEVKVQDLAERLGISSTALSQQLLKLRRAKLVTTRRDGTNIYYSCASKRFLQCLISSTTYLDRNDLPSQQRSPYVRLH